MGSVAERGSGHWRLVVEGPPDPLTGRRRQVTRTVAATTRREAMDALAVFSGEVRRGDRRSSPATRTVGHACKEWLAHASPGLSPNTASELTGSLERYVYPSAVAKRPVNRVSAEDLDRLYDELLRRGGRSGTGLAPGTVRKVHVVLSLVFAQAVRWGWIGKNPAEHASPPKARAPEPSPPEVSIVRQLLDEADATSIDGDPRWPSFLRVAVATGRRRGELCGLRWSEVDLDKATVSIFRVVKLDRTGAGLVVADFPKSARARGTLSLDTDTVSALRELRAYQEGIAALFDAVLGRDAYVFSEEPDASRPWHPQVVTHRFARLCRRLGIEGVRLHDLRHFAATQLLGEGFGVSSVAGRIGNSPAVLLGVYAHWVSAKDADQATHMGELLGGAGSRTPGIGGSAGVNDA